MATLTYDPTPADQPEFTPEEQDSIAVGEALEQQEEQLLAGKYANAQELEKAYVELQRKLGGESEDVTLMSTSHPEEIDSPKKDFSKKQSSRRNSAPEKISKPKEKSERRKSVPKEVKRNTPKSEKRKSALEVIQE